MAESPIVDEDTADALGGDIVGKQTGSSSTLSPYVGEYVTEDVLAQGRAAADMPYEAYTGPLTAGESELQTKAFEGMSIFLFSKAFIFDFPSRNA